MIIFQRRQLYIWIFSILVLGGSQGAEVFGKIIPPAIKMLKEEGHKIEIIQLCAVTRY